MGGFLGDNMGLIVIFSGLHYLSLSKDGEKEEAPVPTSSRPCISG